MILRQVIGNTIFGWLWDQLASTGWTLQHQMFALRCIGPEELVWIFIGFTSLFLVLNSVVWLAYLALCRMESKGWVSSIGYSRMKKGLIAWVCINGVSALYYTNVLLYDITN